MATSSRSGGGQDAAKMRSRVICRSAAFVVSLRIEITTVGDRNADEPGSGGDLQCGNCTLAARRPLSRLSWRLDLVRRRPRATVRRRTSPRCRRSIPLTFTCFAATSPGGQPTPHSSPTISRFRSLAGVRTISLWILMRSMRSTSTATATPRKTSSSSSNSITSFAVGRASR